MSQFAPTGKRVRRIIERSDSAGSRTLYERARIASRAPCSGNVNVWRAVVIGPTLPGDRRFFSLPWPYSRSISPTGKPSISCFASALPARLPYGLPGDIDLRPYGELHGSISQSDW